VLSNVLYPRFGAYSEIMDPLVGITHVVDLTIAYEDIEDTPSMAKLTYSDKNTKILLNYRIFDVKQTLDIRSEEWLNMVWRDKEIFMQKFYADREGLLSSLTQFNVVTHNRFKVFIINLFYILFWFVIYFLVKTIFYSSLKMIKNN